MAFCTHSIYGGSGSSKFGIGLCTGQIYVVDDSIAFTAASSYTLSIRVADDEPAGALTRECSVTVQIEDRNDPPEVSDTSGTVAENSAVDTVVKAISYSDADPGDTISWTVGPHSPANTFGVTSNGRIVVKGPIDFERIGSFRFTVTGCDKGGLCDTGNFEVIVADANDAPVFVDQQGIINENVAANTAVR